MIPAAVVGLANQLMQAPRHLGIHSGGMVLTEEPVSQVCPVEPARMKVRTVSTTQPARARQGQRGTPLPARPVTPPHPPASDSPHSEARSTTHPNRWIGLSQGTAEPVGRGMPPFEPGADLRP